MLLVTTWILRGMLVLRTMEDQGSSGDQGCQLISAQGRGCGLDGWEKGDYRDFIKKMTKREGAVPEILQEWEKTQADLKK